jgi:hypothetical protein
VLTLDSDRYSVIICVVQEIIAELKKFTKQMNKLTRLIGVYDKVRMQPVNNAYLLEKRILEIERILSGLPGQRGIQKLSDWVENEKAKISKLKDDFRFQLGQQLKSMFEKDGMNIRGQYPILRVGFFTLKLNFEFGEAILFYGPEVEKLKSKIPLQPQAIYDAVRQYEQDMKGGSFEAQKLSDDLYAAYMRCLKFSENPPGEKLRITEVLKEYVFLIQPKQFNLDPSRGHYRGCSRLRLSYMLYRLKAADIDTHGMRFHVATFDSTVDKMRSFWIPDNEEGEGTHYEYISFESPHE